MREIMRDVKTEMKRELIREIMREMKREMRMEMKRDMKREMKMEMKREMMRGKSILIGCWLDYRTEQLKNVDIYHYSKISSNVDDGILILYLFERKNSSSLGVKYALLYNAINYCSILYLI